MSDKGILAAPMVVANAKININAERPSWSNYGTTGVVFIDHF
jgi:hypothetical protein